MRPVNIWVLEMLFPMTSPYPPVSYSTYILPRKTKFTYFHVPFYLYILSYFWSLLPRLIYSTDFFPDKMTCSVKRLVDIT